MNTSFINSVWRYIDNHPDCYLFEICHGLFRDGYGLAERKQVGCAISYLIRDNRVSKHKARKPYYRTTGVTA